MIKIIMILKIIFTILKGYQQGGQQQEIFVKIFYLAKIVQKICLNDNLSNEIVEGFSNTLLNIEEDLEFKKFRKFFKKICIL